MVKTKLTTTFQSPGLFVLPGIYPLASLMETFSRFVFGHGIICDPCLHGGFQQIMYAAGIILGPMMFLAKSSLLLLYLRVFGLEKAVRYTIYFALAFMFVLYWVSIPVTGYYCAPSPGNGWSIGSVGKRCNKATIVGLFQGPLNVAFDLFIISLPVPIVLRLQLSFRNRVAVLVLFLTGIL